MDLFLIIVFSPYMGWEMTARRDTESAICREAGERKRGKEWRIDTNSWFLDYNGLSRDRKVKVLCRLKIFKLV